MGVDEAEPRMPVVPRHEPGEARTHDADAVEDDQIAVLSGRTDIW